MMENLTKLIVYGFILFGSGLVLTVLTWPYALATVEVDKSYAVASGIIFILIFTGQLISIIIIAMLSKFIEECKEGCRIWFLATIFYFIIWFSCGAGQLIIVVLLIINAEANSDTGVEAYAGVIIALNIVYMFASSVYSTIIFVCFAFIKNGTMTTS